MPVITPHPTDATHTRLITPHHVTLYRYYTHTHTHTHTHASPHHILQMLKVSSTPDTSDSEDEDSADVGASYSAER